MVHAVHNGTPIVLYPVTYKSNSQLAVIAYTEDGEPYADITVCLPEFKLKPNDQFVDTNNLPGIDEWLEENGLAKYLGVCGCSGYCEYPLMKFNTEKLREEK